MFYLAFPAVFSGSMILLPTTFTQEQKSYQWVKWDRWIVINLNLYSIWHHLETCFAPVMPVFLQIPFFTLMINSLLIFVKEQEKLLP